LLICIEGFHTVAANASALKLNQTSKKIIAEFSNFEV
jgi:hypothetical protein